MYYSYKYIYAVNTSYTKCLVENTSYAINTSYEKAINNSYPKCFVENNMCCDENWWDFRSTNFLTADSSICETDTWVDMEWHNHFNRDSNLNLRTNFTRGPTNRCATSAPIRFIVGSIRFYSCILSHHITSYLTVNSWQY